MNKKSASPAKDSKAAKSKASMTSRKAISKAAPKVNESSKEAMKRREAAAKAKAAAKMKKEEEAAVHAHHRDILPPRYGEIQHAAL